MTSGTLSSLPDSLQTLCCLPSGGSADIFGGFFISWKSLPEEYSLVCVVQLEIMLALSFMQASKHIYERVYSPHIGTQHLPVMILLWNCGAAWTAIIPIHLAEVIFVMLLRYTLPTTVQCIGYWYPKLGHLFYVWTSWKWPYPGSQGEASVTLFLAISVIIGCILLPLPWSWLDNACSLSWMFSYFSEMKK